MKRIHKLLSLILTICIAMSMLTGFAPANAVADTTATGSEVFELPDIVDSVEAKENDYIGRVEAEEKDLYTFVFANGDGTNTMRIYSHPVKYLADDGSIRDISLNIEAKRGGGFVTADHEIVTTFESKLTDGITLEYNDVEIMLVPALGLGTMPTAELSTDGKVVTYEMNDITSFVYELTYAGFKEDIVVEEYTGQTEYEFTLYTNGLTLCEEYGSYYLADAEGNVEATIGDIIVFTADERNNTMGSMTYETVRANQEYVLTIHLDADYLADEDTVYPIRIDPTIEINYDNNGAGAIEDVTLNSNSGSNGSSGSLSVGLRQTYGKSRILMRFPGLNMNDLPGSYQISAASVEIRDLMCEGDELPVYCYVFTGNTWAEGTANWTNVNADSFGTYLSSKTISYGNGVEQPVSHRYSFNILSAVRGWKNGTYNKNKGIIFKAPASVEDGTTYNCKTIASYNRTSYKPSLSVTYRNTSNVSSISGSTYTTSRTLTANYAYRFAFTPSVSDKYSFWTESSIDTHISVYGNSSYTINTGYDDDSGHSYNACSTLYLTAGRTYYIFVQGYSVSTSGSYTFKIRRGLPMSGYEESKNFTTYNSSTYQGYTNCYTYALNVWRNPITGSKFRWNGNNPGEMSGDPIQMADLVDATTAKREIVAAVKRDCVAWGGSANDFYEVNENTMVPEGYYKVVLVLAPGVDYHWYRQVSDLSGRWAHKLSILAATEFDDSNNVIYNPSNADRGRYTEVLGYFALKPPSTYSSKSTVSNTTKDLLEETTDIRRQYSIKTDITLSDFNNFIVGETTEKEVMSMVGSAHDVYGSGYIGERYYTADGFDIVVYYYKGVVEQVRCINDDGTYTILK